MRAGLIPLRTIPRQVEQNLAELERRLTEAARFSPDLVCLPECTLTGYLYEQSDFERFAEPLDGPGARRLADLARRFEVFLCAGLLERAAEGVYNAALLFDRRGHLRLHHRKIEEKPPFLCGRSFRSAETELGRLGILVCGDLFNEQVIAQVDRSLDFLLMPMSRSFDGRSPDAARWEREERQVYLDGVRQAGVTTLIVNALEPLPEEGAFGGALAVRADGALLGESRHGTDQLLLVDW
ncbi:MAG: carbon-nitrogen hydrolase family protein [Anaerolineales bacterium]